MASNWMAVLDFVGWPGVPRDFNSGFLYLLVVGAGVVLVVVVLY